MEISARLKQLLFWRAMSKLLRPSNSTPGLGPEMSEVQRRLSNFFGHRAHLERYCTDTKIDTYLQAKSEKEN